MSTTVNGIENVGRPTRDQAEAKTKAKEIFNKRFEEELLKHADALIARYFTIALENSRRGDRVLLDAISRNVPIEKPPGPKKPQGGVVVQIMEFGTNANNQYIEIVVNTQPQPEDAEIVPSAAIEVQTVPVLANTRSDKN
jgi:hypothetical protein